MTTIHVLAHFDPQEWIDDCAVSIDPEGEQEWDASAAVAALAPAYRSALIEEIRNIGYAVDRDDVLRDDPNAPDWVREHLGPFTITLSISPEREARS